MLLRLICLLCLVGIGFGQSTDFNELLDDILDVLRPKIVDEGKDQLPIDNIDYDWSYKVIFFTVTGSITCNKGKVRYLSSIKRTGDASGKIVSGGIAVEASVGLGVMEFLFDKCTLSVRNFITLSESIGGVVGKNSLKMKLLFSGNTARINRISVDQLSNIDLTTGTNIIHQLENSILNGLVSQFHDVILNSINNQLRQFDGKIITIPMMKHHH